jgi:uncharacterized protein (DUF885 family)
MTTPTPEPDASTRLHSLFDESWEYFMRENPLMATHCGDHRFNDTLPDVSEAAHDRQHEKTKEILDALHAIDCDNLSEEDRLNYDIFELELTNRIRGHAFKPFLRGVTKKGGYYKHFTYLPDSVPLKTVTDFENYLARLKAFGDWSMDHIELMRSGVSEGIVPPRILLDGIDESITSVITKTPEESLFYKPFLSLPGHFDEGTCNTLQQECRNIIETVIHPAYRNLLAYLEEEYIDAGRESIAAADLPDGKAYYEFLVWKFTSLETTPQEIFDTGMQEVQTIRAEMENLIKKAGFDGSFKEFIEFLRTDKQFYVDSPEQLLKEAAMIAKRMDGELPGLFKTLPRTPYGVKPIPDHIAPLSVPGYYSLPSGDFTKAGFFWVNTYNPGVRPLYQLESLALHEAVPGHHLQFALQMELQNVPNFRRFGGDTAYCEGWALYAEALGKEVGFYDTVYSDFGRLTFRMWRACRLVVDPGMHYLGWTRQQAIDFMQENTALSLLNIENEVDRYIAGPGQAVSYMMGELKMWDLRRKAEAAFGDEFDIREYHDKILENGGIPLKVLEKKIDEWLAGM